MKPRSHSHPESGLTLVELLVVIAIVLLFAALLPPRSHVREKAVIAKCLSNLRGVGIAETMWAEDHQTNFSALISTNQGGTMEYVAAASLDLHYQALASYGLLPQVLLCPADSRPPAADYASLKNTNISYFTSLDAGVSNKALFLSGDRNMLIGGKTVSPGFATISSNSALGWSGEMHNKIRNRGVGTLLFTDGHAEAADEKRLSALTTSMGTATNRLVFP